MHMSTLRTTTAVLTTGLALSAALLTAPAVSAAKLDIGVAPSANGYVMAGQPTQVAVNMPAKIFRQVNGKWMLVGNATKNRAVPITFNEAGIYSLRAKPKKGKARVVKVGVYDYVAWTNRGGTIAMGGQVFPGSADIAYRARSLRTYRASIPASRGCVAVDVGVRDLDISEGRYPYQATIDVLSTGAPAWASGPQSGVDGFAALGIPISGDAAVEFSATGGNVNAAVRALCL